MKKTIEEILTYEIFSTTDGFYSLSLPVQNLINPKFMLKNKDLYILLHSYTQGYIIKNLPPYIIKSILKKQCVIKENLASDIRKEHLISLI
jgi:hypothetical protein